MEEPVAVPPALDATHHQAAQAHLQGMQELAVRNCLLAFLPQVSNDVLPYREVLLRLEEICRTVRERLEQKV